MKAAKALLANNKTQNFVRRKEIVLVYQGGKHHRSFICDKVLPLTGKSERLAQFIV